MTDQIRSADLLVKNALSNPQILADLKSNPEQALEKLGKDTVQMLPRAILDPMPDPDPKTTNAIWIIVVCSFAAVMLYSAFVLGSGVSTALAKETVYVTKGETILTLFTTVVAFLAGLLAPSPVKK